MLSFPRDFERTGMSDFGSSGDSLLSDTFASLILFSGLVDIASLTVVISLVTFSPIRLLIPLGKRGNKKG